MLELHEECRLLSDASCVRTAMSSPFMNLLLLNLGDESGCE
jgi:hypothetical protein